MVFFSWIEALQRKAFYDNGTCVILLQIFQSSLCSLQIILVETVDAGAILGSMICSLTIERSRVNDVEE